MLASEVEFVINEAEKSVISSAGSARKPISISRRAPSVPNAVPMSMAASDMNTRASANRPTSAIASATGASGRSVDRAGTIPHASATANCSICARNADGLISMASSGCGHRVGSAAQQQQHDDQCQEAVQQIDRDPPLLYPTGQPGGTIDQRLHRLIDPVPETILDHDPVTGPRIERGGQIAPHPEECLEDLPDRKSTRLNSSHTVISYAVFCL